MGALRLIVLRGRVLRRGARRLQIIAWLSRREECHLIGVGDRRGLVRMGLRGFCARLTRNFVGRFDKLWIVLYDWGSKFDLAADAQWQDGAVVLGPNGTLASLVRNVTILSVQNSTRSLELLQVENLTTQ